MPVTLRETGARLGEQTAQPSRRRVTIIQAGWGSSGYYSRDMLERDGPTAFPAGTQMFLDHPGRAEESDRPERSVRDLAARIATTPRMDGDALVAEAEVFEVWRPVIDSIAGDIGLSIRALGETEQGEADGRTGPIVTTLTEGISVDFVTRAGAGGKVGQLIESARRQPLAEQLNSEIVQKLRDLGNERFGADRTYVYAEDFDTDQGWVVYCISPSDGESRYIRIGFQRDGGDVELVGAAVAVDRVVRYIGTSQQQEAAERLKEARNVGHYFESRIHKAFTEAADDHFGQGHLSRPERIAMSSAIGDALDSFSESLTKNAPQLYQRDLYAGPDAAGATVSEAAAGRANKEGDMPNEDRLAALEESVGQIKTQLTETETKLGEAEKDRDKANQRAELAESRLDDIAAEKIVREATIEIEGRKDPISVFEGLPPRAVNRAVQSAMTETLPRTEDGKLDKDKLAERAVKAAKDERSYLAEAGAGGSGITGFGATRPSVTDVTDEQLSEAFSGLGLSEKAATAAANGR